MSSFPRGKAERLKNYFLQLVFQIHFSSGLFPQYGRARCWQCRSPRPGGGLAARGIQGSPTGAVPRPRRWGGLRQTAGPRGHGPLPCTGRVRGCVLQRRRAGHPEGHGQDESSPQLPPQPPRVDGGGGSPPARVSDVMKCQLLPSLSSASLKPTWFNQESLQFISS